MTTLSLEKNNIVSFDKDLLTSVISDVLEDYLEKEQDKHTKKMLSNDMGVKSLITDFKAVLGK